MRMLSASPVFFTVCREPTLTTRTTSFSGCLDYIWLSKQHWRVQSTLEMPFVEPAGQPGPPQCVTALEACPNKEQPSDHLAVGCEALLLVSASGGGDAAAGEAQQRQRLAAPRQANAGDGVGCIAL